VIVPKKRLALRHAIVAVLLSSGCHAPTAPGAPLTFVLASIDGRPLPTALSANDAQAPRIVWETLYLDGAGTATRARTVLVASPAVEQGSTVRYQYALNDGVLTMGSGMCGPADICIAPETGHLVGGTLTLTVPGSPTAPVLVYQQRNLVD
jgi:hypothetical protein